MREIGRWGFAFGALAVTVAVVPGPVFGQAAGGRTPPLVLDHVTVIDVEHGERLLDRRVVIAGDRIQALGAADKTQAPKGAQVIDATGKYLIPGLWDMHTHSGRSAELFYPLFLANGITGIRDAGSPVPLDTLRQWRREILAGARVGPPRQILSGQSVGQLSEEVWAQFGGQPAPPCQRSEQRSFQACVADPVDARHYVDSLKAAGADMIKPRVVDRAIYFAVAAEARRLGIPFGGHIHKVTAREATDSGARIIDHLYAGFQLAFGPVWQSAQVDSTQDLNFHCWSDAASVEQCQPLADRLRRNDTWWVPTLVEADGGDATGYPIVERLRERVQGYWADSVRNPFEIPGSTEKIFSVPVRAPADSSGAMAIVRRVGMPILAGTDVMGTEQAGAPFPSDRTPAPGFSLHAELAIYVTDGLSPLEALQTATLNPARMWHATDSLGTVAAGKLADLVLLDADPLADIANTTAIRAVVANGRYFDRAALDRLLAQVQTDAQAQIQAPAPAGP